MKDLKFSTVVYALKSALIGALFFIVPHVIAQEIPTTVTPLDWTDTTYMKQQRERVNRLTSDQLGTPIRGNTSDLVTLQRVIDKKLIKRTDKLALQALGIVLGDVFLLKEPELEWKVYEDNYGRSRALCIKKTQDCLFPATMLSRRMKAGLLPNVNKVFIEALDLIATHLPPLPYGVKRTYTAD